LGARRSGAWSLWPPGYLLLEIARHAGREIEPVLIYTADEEITVTFGYWEAHFDELTQGDDDTPLEAALRTVEGWLEGRVRTVVSFKADGSWCGSSLLEESDEIAAVRRHIEWVRDSDPARVQIRSSKREDWREIEVSPEWLA